MSDVSAHDIVETVRSALLVLTPELRLRSTNRAGLTLLEIGADEALDRPLSDFPAGQCIVDALGDRLQRIVIDDASLDDFEVECRDGTLAGRVFLAGARKVYRPGNHVPFLLLSLDDVTKAQEAQAEAERAWRLAQNIVDTVRDPLVILEGDMTVVTASRAFLRLFKVHAAQVIGKPLHEIGEGQWNVPSLRDVLLRVVPDDTALDGYEVEDDFPDLGRRIFKLNARKVYRPGNHFTRLLLVFEDVTEARLLERHRDLLSSELAHRIKNSLQIITSFVSFEIRQAEASCVPGYESMQARISAIAELYDVIARSASFGPVPAGDYLDGIAASLRSSLLGQGSGIKIRVDAEPLLIDPDHAVTVGLIVNELATNAIKYAFPEGRGSIAIGLAKREEGVVLSVSDDGVGLSGKSASTGSGLGSRFVDAFVRQLGGSLAVGAGDAGATFTVRMPATVLAS